jgi:hypothetical protein
MCAHMSSLEILSQSRCTCVSNLTKESLRDMYSFTIYICIEKFNKVYFERSVSCVTELRDKIRYSRKYFVFMLKPVLIKNFGLNF